MKGIWSDLKGKSHDIGGVIAALVTALAVVFSVTQAPAQEEAIQVGRPTKASQADIDAGKKIYFKKCVWCHGVTGDGEGFSAFRLSTRPRNFNPGTFKIRHTASGELPLEKDLVDTVTHGLPGSVMPPWDGILTPQERHQVVAFVMNNLVLDRKFDDPDETFNSIPVIDALTPPSSAGTPEAIERGKEVFLKKGRCFECHGLEGRGDGNLTMKDDFGFPIFPADLTKPWNFRGSRRDAYNIKNVFREVSTGLNGTPMPSFKDTLTDDERWDVASFVMSLSEFKGMGGAPFRFKIDSMTQKPAIKFLIGGKKVSDNVLPSTVDDPKWMETGYYYVGMASQIIRKPRHFIRINDDIRVRVLFNDEEVAFLFEWNDRTNSKEDPNGTPAYGWKAVRTAELTHEPPPTGIHEGVFWDGIAVQIPQKWQQLSPPEKPYFIHGDSKKGVDLWKWTSDGTVKAFTGNGIDNLVERADSSKRIKVEDAKFSNGQWRLIMKRALQTPDKEGDAQIEVGKYIPVTFFAWDGDAGEAGGKMALSTFYYLLLEPPMPRAAYLAPPIAFGGFLVTELLILWRYKHNKNVPKLKTGHYAVLGEAEIDKLIDKG